MHAPNSNEKYLKKILEFGNRVSIAQPSGHITICVDPQSNRL